MARPSGTPRVDGRPLVQDGLPLVMLSELNFPDREVSAGSSKRMPAPFCTPPPRATVAMLLTRQAATVTYLPSRRPSIGALAVLAIRILGLSVEDPTAPRPPSVSRP